MEILTLIAIENYKQYLITEEKSKATIEKYVRDLTAFMNWLENREITKTEVLAYKAKLTETYAPTSVL